MEIENGKYKARGVKGELGLTSTGKEQVGVELALTGDGYVGTSLTWYGYFTDAALPFTIKTLRTLGWQGSDLADLSGIDANEVELVVENEEYEGKNRTRVKFINAIGGLSMKEPLPADRAKAFAAAMKGKILGVEQANGQRPQAAKSKPSSAPAPRANPEPKPAADFDVPF